MSPGRLHETTYETPDLTSDLGAGKQHERDPIKTAIHLLKHHCTASPLTKTRSQRLDRAYR